MGTGFSRHEQRASRLHRSSTPPGRPPSPLRITGRLAYSFSRAGLRPAAALEWFDNYEVASIMQCSRRQAYPLMCETVAGA